MKYSILIIWYILGLVISDFILYLQAEKNKEKTGKDDVAPATAYDGGGGDGGGVPAGGMSSNEQTNIQGGFSLSI